MIWYNLKTFTFKNILNNITQNSSSDENQFSD